MNILHVCNIAHENANGISGIVPQYVLHQSKYENVDLLNLRTNQKIDINKKYDLIIIHGVYEINTLIFFYRYIYKRYNYVFVPHGGLTKISQMKSRRKKYIANQILFKKFYKEAMAVQFLSENEKQNSINIGNTRAIICSSGMDLPKERLYTVHNREEFIFVYIGRIDIFYKGLDLLLCAVSLVKDSMRENCAKIKIIGTNNDNNPLDELYKLISDNNLEDIVSIDLTGRFGEEKKRELLDADCFVQTSRSEGLPIGVLEALSYGMPLAITKPVGFVKLIDKYKCGYYCEPTVEGIASMLVQTIENRTRLEDMSINAYAAAREFDWEYVTQETLTIYSELCQKE